MVEGFETWGDDIILMHPHQDPGCAVLNVFMPFYGPGRGVHWNSRWC